MFFFRCVMVIKELGDLKDSSYGVMNIKIWNFKFYVGGVAWWRGKVMAEACVVFGVAGPEVVLEWHPAGG